jgi:anti-sigma regulatory factor (Ser/Thr protein kinase)
MEMQHMSRTGRVAGPVLIGERHFHREDLPALRAFVSEHAARTGAAREQVAILVLTASELATNAIIHGGGAGRLRLWRGASHIVCEVTDSGRGMAADAGTQPPTTAIGGGRGLWLIRSLTDDVDIDSGASGTTVAAQLALRPRRTVHTVGAHRSA